MQPSSASTKAPSIQNDNNAVRPAQIRPVATDFHSLSMRRMTHQASTIVRIHDSYWQPKQCKGRSFPNANNRRGDKNH